MNQQAAKAATPAEELKITSARISQMPKTIFDPMPEVWVTTSDGVDHRLFSYYPDEIRFTEAEFIGLTLTEALRRKAAKDLAYLRS